MKRILNVSLAAIIVFTACNSGDRKTADPVPVKTKETDTIPASQPVNTPGTEQSFACPMHPEVKGRKNDTCPKCGMKLTEPVKEEKKP